MQGDHFGDSTFDDNEEARRITVALAELDEATLPREIGQLVERARRWRSRHASVAG